MSGGIGEMSVYNLGDDLVDRHVREGRGDRLAIVSEGVTSPTGSCARTSTASGRR
jgi:hypothetical protein